MTKILIRRNIGIEDSRRLALVKLHTTKFVSGELVQALYRTGTGKIDTLLALGIGNGTGEDYYKLISAGGIDIIEDIVTSLPDVSALTHQERYIWKNEGTYFEVYKDPSTDSRLLDKLEGTEERKYFCASNGYFYYFSFGTFKREDEFESLGRQKESERVINEHLGIVDGRLGDLETKDTEKQGWLEKIDSVVFPVELKIEFSHSIPAAKKSTSSDYSGVEDSQVFDYSSNYIAKYKLTAKQKGVDVLGRCTFRLKGQTGELRVADDGIFSVSIPAISGTDLTEKLQGDKFFVLLVTKDGEQVRRSDGLRFISNTVEYKRLDPVITVLTCPVKVQGESITEFYTTEAPGKIRVGLGKGEIKLTLGDTGKDRTKYEGNGDTDYRHALIYPKKLEELVGLEITGIKDQNGMDLRDDIIKVELSEDQVPETFKDKANPIYTDTRFIAIFMKETVPFTGSFDIIFKYSTNV